MTFKLIFNGHQYFEEKIRAKDWIEFIRILNDRVRYIGEPPDIIYLISIRE